MGKFTKEEIEMLSQKRYVKWVNETNIKFTDEFKERFIDEYYNLGKGPTEIFLRAGFDTDVIGAKRIERCSSNWRAAYEKRDHSYKEDNSAELLAAKKTMISQEEEIVKLKAEIELLKKALALGKGRCEKKVYGNADLVKMIDETIEKYDLHGCIKELCDIVGMRPGDYYYRKRQG